MNVTQLVYDVMGGCPDILPDRFFQSYLKIGWEAGQFNQKRTIERLT